MAKFARFLERLLHIPEDGILPADVDLTPYYQPWGFSIYRTAYTPSSDQHWQNLLNDIRADVAQQVTGTDEAQQADPIAAHILSLFRLDARSDVETLDGFDVEQVRNAYKNKVGGEPMNVNQRGRRCFLLVDKDVLEEHETKSDIQGHRLWVKCVEADYVASDYIPKNTRLGGQRYFGWMKMSTRSVPQLWSILGLRWLSDVAPATTGEVWHEEADF
jgi:hypothetical protein